MGRIRRNCSPWKVIYLLFYSVGFSTQEEHVQAPNNQLLLFMTYMGSTLPSLLENKFREVIDEKLEDIISTKISDLLDEKLPNIVTLLQKEITQITERNSEHFEELVLKLTNLEKNIKRIENDTSTLIIEPLHDINTTVSYFKENADEFTTIVNSTEFLQDHTGDVKEFQKITTEQLQTIMKNSELLVESTEETGVIQANTTDLITAMITVLETKASSSQITGLQNVLDQMATRTDLTQVKGSMATKSDVTELQNALAYQISLIQDEVDLVAKKTDIASIKASLRNVPSKSDLRPIQNSVSAITSLATKSSISSLDSSVNKILGIAKELPGEFTHVDGEYFLIVPTRLPWADARRYCQGKGGDLAVPSDLNALKSYVLSQGVSGYFWLGGSDLSSDGTWQWVDGSSMSSSYDSVWHTGSQKNNSDEDCLFLTTGTDSHILNDYYCSSPLRFICERW